MKKKPVYEGDKPYIFISYAHANAPAVMQVVEELCDLGYRVWYDEGIEVGSEWPEYIASRLMHADLMIAFLSNAYMRSDNCRKEMHFALTKKIPLINIFLEETKLSPGMEMQIGNIFALMKYCMSEEVFEEKLLAAPQLTKDLSDTPVTGKTSPKEKKKKAAVPVDIYAAQEQEQAQRKKKKRRRFISFGVVFAILTALLVLVIVGWSTGLIARIMKRTEQAPIPNAPIEMEEITWHDSALEAAARAYSGIEDGPVSVADLTDLTELHIRGTTCSFDRGALPESEQTDELQNLTDLRWFPDLTYLFLEDQAITSLETLPPCGIKELILHHCAVTDLKGIGSLTLLRELDVTDCPLRQLNTLDLCLDLRHLSLIDCNVTDLSVVKPLTKLVEVSFSGCSLEGMETVFGLSSLSDVALYDCDLRGSFFYDFDAESRIVNLLLSDCELNSTRNLEDFSGLTTLTLIRTGETLDWSELKSLPSLKKVYADVSMRNMLEDVLEGSKIALEPATD